MNHFLKYDNITLALCKQFKTGDNYLHSFISNKIIESSFVSNRTSEITSTFPLYLYPETTDQITTAVTMEHAPLSERVPNLNQEIVNKIAIGLGLNFTPESVQTRHALSLVQTRHALSLQKTSFAPIDILDYIYAVLHSPNYREKYKEFLKIDFPKIPYPKNTKTFWDLVALGSQIREIHLLESPKVEDYITQFNIDGDCIVGKVFAKPNDEAISSNEKIASCLVMTVFINETQHFENVPEVAWNFYIGGYQPAQKWLKDRKGRKLEFDDILHYQKIIVALTETDRIMKEINEIDIKFLIKTFDK